MPCHGNGSVICSSGLCTTTTATTTDSNTRLGVVVLVGTYNTQAGRHIALLCLIRSFPPTPTPPNKRKKTLPILSHKFPGLAAEWWWCCFDGEPACGLFFFFFFFSLFWPAEHWPLACIFFLLCPSFEQEREVQLSLSLSHFWAPLCVCMCVQTARALSLSVCEHTVNWVSAAN